MSILQSLNTTNIDFLDHLMPPPRFANTTFLNYIPSHPSQQHALEVVQAFSVTLNKSVKKTFLFPFALKRNNLKNLYLDGLYGVGKTHLMAALFYSFQNENKFYFSFTELIYLIGLMGLQSAVKAFSKTKLLCIDEFELDDPGNTTLAVAFLSQLIHNRTAIVSTSNTLPDHLGKGRFAVMSFERELKYLSNTFQTIKMEGHDFRQQDETIALNHTTWQLENPANKNNSNQILSTHMTMFSNTMTYSAFMQLIQSVHPMKYLHLVKAMPNLMITQFNTISDQFDALRFVYFIDKVYDERLSLAVLSSTEIHNIFPKEFFFNAYAKKYYRCISRLNEICQESFKETTTPIKNIQKNKV